jgi:hypothetical protein
MSASDYAAWYAAIVATLVLIWDFIKWKKSGPQIKAEAFSGWKSFGIDELEADSITVVKATNIGDRPTTISSFGMYWYPKGVSVKDKVKRKAFIIKSGLAGLGEVPKKVDPGDVWQGLAKENEEFDKMLTEGTVYIALGFSHTDKEFLVKVTANNALNKSTQKASLFRRLCSFKHKAS